jgi:hypothetical protein
MTTNNNTIPQGQVKVTNLMLLAISGALAHEGAIGLEHNTAAALTADYHDYAGNPATPAVLGKQPLLNAALLAIKTTQAAADAALKTGRQFCQGTLGTLKPALGHRWNGQWNAAGFTAGNLQVPALPLALLAQVRQFFEANPAKESGIYTAAGAQAQVAAIQAAVLARDNAKGARHSAKAARDASFKQVRKRLSDLRAELAQLIAPTDDRWYAFGFRRPADGKVPTAVTGLVLTPLGAGAGAVLVSWGASSYAEDYRVSWKPSSMSSGEPGVLAGLVAETQFALTGLPSGVPIVVSVTARNNSGETEPMEAAIVVP